MQAVFDLPIGSTPKLMQFAGGRNYMMRSEKRRSTNVPSGSSGKRPPRRPRRRRAGFFYKLFTILLLVVLWPVGLLLLWRRKLRWGVGTKLLASVVTLIACIILVGFALTVQTDNAKYTAVQDSINSFLDEAADVLIETGGVVADKAVEIGGSVADFGEALWMKGSVMLANGIDSGVDLANSVKSGIKGMLRTDEAEPTATPEAEATDAPTYEPTEAPTKAATDVPSSDPSDAPSGVPSDAPTAEASAAASAEPSAEVTDAPETATDAPTEAVTDEPTDEPTEAATDAPTSAPTQTPTAVPTFEVKSAPAGMVYIPETQPGAGTQLRGGTLDRSGVLTEGEVVLPEPEVPVFTVKSAEDATVYYNNNGRFYHMASTCKGMTSANPHSFIEAIEAGLGMCVNCESPDPLLLAKYIVWTDEANIAHLSDSCAAFSGMWKLISAEDALAGEYLGCSECEADAYLAAIAAGEEIIIEAAEAEVVEAATQAPTAEPTETPTDAPTEVPTAAPTQQPTDAPTSAPTEAPTQTPAPTVEPEPTTGVITPTVALKPAGLATVYHTKNGSWYHMASTCTNMYGAWPYALEACVSGSKVYKTCRTCNAPSAELIDQYCLWMDEEERFHTTDECIAFTGRYTLVPRDEALLREAVTDCANCGSEQYLIPETQIAYIPYVEATPAP